MSTMRATFVLLLSLLVTISVPNGKVNAQAPAVRLFLESERPSFTLGEPVYLIARLRNESGTSARLIPLLNPSDGLLVVTLTGPRGERLGFVPLSVRDNDVGPVDLAPRSADCGVVSGFLWRAGVDAKNAWHLHRQSTVHHS